MNPLKPNDLQDFLQADKAPCCKAFMPEKLKDDDQIASKAATICADNVGKVHGIVVDESLFKQAIKSAIEKATSHLKLECETLERELMSLSIKSADDFQQSRAAQASDDYLDEPIGPKATIVAQQSESDGERLLRWRKSLADELDCADTEADVTEAIGKLIESRAAHAGESPSRAMVERARRELWDIGGWTWQEVVSVIPEHSESKQASGLDHKYEPGYMKVCRRCGLEFEAHQGKVVK